MMPCERLGVVASLVAEDAAERIDPPVANEPHEQVVADFVTQVAVALAEFRA